MSDSFILSYEKFTYIFNLSLKKEVYMKYLYSKDDLIFAECESCGRILKFKTYQLPEIRTGVECFCGNSSNSIINIPENALSSMQETQQIESGNTVANTKMHQAHNTDYSSSSSNFTPRCPTCGSTNVHRISLASKAIGGYLFGIYSSNIRNTFECYNCRYKW